MPHRHRYCNKPKSDHIRNIKTKNMKKFVLVSGAAVIVATFYVWGSRPARHVGGNNPQYISGVYTGDTLPTRRDTLPHKDTMKRKDTLP
jgi:hypothetical protein